MKIRRPTYSQFARTLGLVWDSSPRWTIAQVMLVFLQAALAVALLILFKLVVDTVAVAAESPHPQDAMSRLALLVGLTAAATLAAAACNSIDSAIGEIHRDLVNDHMSGIIHAHAVDLDLAHYENAATQDVLHHTQATAGARAGAILASLMQVLRNGIALTAIAGLLFTFNGWIALLLVVGDLPGAYFRVRSAWLQHQWEREHVSIDRQSRYYDILLGVHAAHEVRLFGLGGLFIDRFRALRGKLIDEHAPLIRQRVISEIAGHATSSLAMLVIYGVVSYEALSGRFTIGAVVMYFAAFQRGHGHVRDLLYGVARLYENSLFMADIETIIGLEKKVSDPPQPVAVPTPLEDGIRFEHVGFQYPGAGRPALVDVNLLARPGEHIAIVGANGSGKTTLVKLLTRMYDPTHGQVTADGIPLQLFAQQAWRRQISAFVQDHGKYLLSVRENIGLGNPDHPSNHELVVAAAKRSGAHEVVEGLRAGYDTPLGKLLERGVDLSVGEWQKIALARTYLRTANILVLDEPTNAMDARSEEHALQAVWATAPDAIAILITHRLSAARRADRIYVLAAGRIVESGTHDELILLNGEYKQLFATQAQNYQ